MLSRLALAAAVFLLAQPAFAIDPSCPTEATVPKPPTRARPERVERIMAARPDPADRVLLVGASGIVRWPMDLRNEAFGKPSFAFGLGADQTSQMLWRLERANFAGHPFERVVISGLSNNLRQEPCEIAAGAVAVMTKVREMFPSARISVISILPRGRNLAVADRKFLEANRLIRQAVEAAGQHYVDAHPVFRKRCGYDDTCPLYTDGIHQSREGYQVLGDLLKR